MVADNPVAGDHVYVAAPPAVNIVDEPLHIVAGAHVITAVAFTFTVAVVVFTHPLTSVPVIVYVVVAAGFAVTVAPVVALNPVAGDHVYVAAPLAVNVPGIPGQIVVEGTVTTGNGFTVTVTVIVLTQPAALVPVIA